MFRYHALFAGKLNLKILWTRIWKRFILFYFIFIFFFFPILTLANIDENLNPSNTWRIWNLIRGSCVRWIFKFDFEAKKKKKKGRIELRGVNTVFDPRFVRGIVPGSIGYNTTHYWDISISGLYKSYRGRGSRAIFSVNVRSNLCPRM